MKRELAEGSNYQGQQVWVGGVVGDLLQQRVCWFAVDIVGVHL